MKLVFATHNIHKLEEIQALLPQTIELLSLSDIGCNEEIAETAATIEGNALLKAQYVKKHYHTGLEVTALGGAPGVFSARYAGAQKSDIDNMALLLKNMEAQQDRSAHFKTVIALCMGDEVRTFEGIAKGHITKEPVGTNGFGYDPIFVPEGYSQTFAELSAAEKNRISHRAKAFGKLIEALGELSSN